MRIGFVGLGNLGGKLAGSLLRNGAQVVVHDLDRGAAKPLLEGGAIWAGTPAELADGADAVATCLPSPEASARVMEGDEGALRALGAGSLWLEMSTTDGLEVERIGGLVSAAGGLPLDCPVTGGCHRAATGNISILAGGERRAFDLAFPFLRMMGRKILHTGPLGSASALKVVTNYLASANLVSLCEAMATSKMAGLDLATAFEAIRISSGNSFVHETETQVMLNGSRDVGFTLDLARKDMRLFCGVAERAGVPLEIAPVVLAAFEDAIARYGEREWSTNVVRRIEDATGASVVAGGFPARLVDDEPETPGEEALPPA